MQITQKLRPWLAKTSVRFVLGLLLVVLVVGYIKSNQDTEADNGNGAEKIIVTTTSPAKYSGDQSLSLLGNVRAFTEAEVTSERAGRVVSVPVKLGQKVSAGQVLATIENAAESAAVLQAEGVYDAAVANAAQNTVSVDQAVTQLQKEKTNAVSTFKSAYNTVNGVILNNIDSFFSSPNDRIIGLKIDGRGHTATLNAERASFQTILPAWNAKTQTISVNSDLEAELDYAENIVQKTITMVDTFISIFNQQENSNRYTDAELQVFSTSFTALRSNLIGVQSSIDSARNAMQSTSEGVKRAELTASGSTASASDAQVKQALGSLRAAQANLAKTILRSPVSGTVNSLSVRTGDFINSFAPVAIVANNNALEVITYISDSERDFLNEGDTVLIEGEYEGVVTQIAPAVDQATRKTEVRIATENTDIVNGDTVRVTKEVKVGAEVETTIRVPLTAVKFERENGSVFVVEDGLLVLRPVVIGKVLGGSVEITEGLDVTDEFVVDARGLVAGEEVEIR